MPAKPNGIWDFKSYNERTWFRDLIFIFLSVLSSYVATHLLFVNGKSNYEYTKLNQDQMQFISRIYLDYEQSQKSATTSDGAGNTKPVNKPGAPSAVGSQANNGNAQVQPKGAAKLPNPKASSDQTITNPKPNQTTAGKKAVKDTCLSKDTCPCIRVMEYLNNIFEKQLDTAQYRRIKELLSQCSSQEATAFLNGTRFKVHSYFWLVGPSVYWEVVYWSLFGVLCSLLFILGAVGSNATTDLGNPQSQFDSSEILGQVAKMLYAPVCTLVVVFGYNFFSGQNVVNIDANKGLIVFAFIGGFYSSRVISLMDRLKDVLLPNSGSASLPPTPASPTVIPQLKVQLVLDPSMSPPTAAAAGGSALNSAIVKIQAVGNSTVSNGTHAANDPDGLFTFTAVTQGSYVIQASLLVTPPGAPAATLTGTTTGPIQSGIAPITLSIK